MKGKRLHILWVVISCLILAVLLLTTACGQKAPTPGQTIELKFASYPPPIGTVYDKMFAPWAQTIAERTSGRVKITFYPGESLAKAPDLYDAVLQGSADIIWTDPEFTPGVFPRSEIMTKPMLFPSAEIGGEIFWKLMEDYMMDTEYKNVKVLWVNALGSMQMWTNSKQVKTLEDLKGMKFGAQNPSVARMLEALGATAQVIPEPEIFGALERNLVEGRIAEMELAWVFKTYEVTKYRTAGLDLGINTGVTLMNLNAWNRLPKDIQKIFDETTGAAFSKQCGKLMDEAANMFQGMIVGYDAKAGNPAIYNVPASERARWASALAPLIDQWAAEKEAKGVPAKAMLKDVYARTK